MIYPVPAGVDPNSHTCGCGGRLTMPWNHERQAHVLQCVNDHGHETYTSKNNGKTKMLAGPNGQKVEVDVLTQQPTKELAPISDYTTALARTERAKALDLFPTKNMDPDQLALIAEVAWAYGLDPMFGEIIPYQGKPYITIKGRRRLDAANGNEVGISFRPPTEDEEKYWTKNGAMSPRDVISICVGKLPSGTVVEGLGRVLESERQGHVDLPVVKRPIEMAEVRAERRMRERAFGPVAKPVVLTNIDVGEMEIDEAMTVDGTVRDITNEPAMPTPGGGVDMPDLGACLVHETTWFAREDTYKHYVTGSHKIEGTNDWCKLSDVVGAILKEQWTKNTGGYHKPDVDEWLKGKFEGKTWSKMNAIEMLKAVDLLRVNLKTGEVPQPENDDLPEDDPEAEQGKMLPAEAQAEH